MHQTMRHQIHARKTLRADARTLIETCVGWNSRIAARRASLFLDRELAATGLTVAQLGLLALIAVMADDTMANLGNQAGLEQSTLSRNLRTLEAEGLVEIASVERDQRRRAVWLTEAGVRRLEAALPVWRKAHAKIATDCPPDFAQRLVAATESLANL